MKWLLLAALLTSGCASSEDVVIASGQSPTSLATDGAWVVWTNRTGEVMRAQTAGGAPEQIAFAESPASITLASGDVFFTAKDGVWKNDALVTPADHAWAIAAGASRVFWTTNATAGPVMTCGSGDACVPAKLAGGDASFAIAMDDTNVYWSDWNAIWTCAIDGCIGGPKPLAAVAGHVPLAVGASRIYWAENDVVLACDKRACGEPDVIATRQSGVTALAAEGAHVYWLTSSALMRDGVVIAALDAPVALALDAENVYVAAGDRVVKIGKN